MKFSLIIPIHNEQAALKKTLADINSQLTKVFGNSYEIIMSENGSTDQTFDTLNSLKKRYNRLRIVSIPEANYGLAMKKGFLEARGEFMANSSMDWYDIPFIERAMQLMSSNDIVVGTKARPGNDRRPFLRRAISKSYHTLLRILFGLQVTDTHGIILFRRSRVIKPISNCVMDWSVFPSEVIIRSQRAGLRITETDIQVEEKRARKKSILKRSLRAAGGLLRLRLILWTESLTGKNKRDTTPQSRRGRSRKR